MNKIIFPRKSYSGSLLTQASFEKWYKTRANEAQMIQNLRSITSTQTHEQTILNYLTDSVTGIAKDGLLTMPPQEMQTYIQRFKKQHITYLYTTKGGSQISEIVTFEKYFDSRAGKQLRNKILGAFNYAAYRGSLLIDTIKKINIKSCPYCNAHYTLYVLGKGKRADKAILEFDHFFPKSRYPFFSMSLYNLIPSCPQCNGYKGTIEMDIRFNPYHAAISDLFTFKLGRWKDSKTALNLQIGAKVSTDNINIKLEYDSGLKSEMAKLERFARITDQYSRHKDIVQEVLDKRYAYAYYNSQDSFKFDKSKFVYTADLKRLLLGTYTETNEIEKRPIAKFIQDIWSLSKP